MQLPHLPIALAQQAADAYEFGPFSASNVDVQFDGGEFAVGWGTLALINAGLAQGKNRSGFAWFLISLLLGPIATFLLVAFCDKLPYYDKE